MINREVDVAVIGGGPAGLAAAVSAKENGAKRALVLDRNSWLGGILPQCIHDGFGVEELGVSLTGPEYAEKYIDMADKIGVKMMSDTMVLQFDKKREIIAVNKKGVHRIRAKAVVLAMGCREKTRWNAMIPGDRPSGIFTAGVAQAFINLYNIMPGKNVVILGSGDVGLITARRLKFEGANVLGVVEFLPFASGLPRNVVQCLDDYEIPLFLNHTVTCISGRERLESVTIAQVDNKMIPIPGSEREIKCDTLLLSLGLIPENELSKDALVEIDGITGGPVVDQDFETSIPGVFSCGNCLQVYDTVDMLSSYAKLAGKNAAEFKARKKQKKKNIRVLAGRGVRHIIPQVFSKPGSLSFTFRGEKPCGASDVYVKSDGKVFFKKKLRFVNPANMIQVKIDISPEMIKSSKTLEVSIDEN
jgi:NADPH-dependent 2,4-dienoyl-CoA reductase/sulfur reductase-like enzyme